MGITGRYRLQIPVARYAQWRAVRKKEDILMKAKTIAGMIMRMVIVIIPVKLLPAVIIPDAAGDITVIEKMNPSQGISAGDLYFGGLLKTDIEEIQQQSKGIASNL